MNNKKKDITHPAGRGITPVEQTTSDDQLFPVIITGNSDHQVLCEEARNDSLYEATGRSLVLQGEE